jgi:hypothetical protein
MYILGLDLGLSAEGVSYRLVDSITHAVEDWFRGRQGRRAGRQTGTGAYAARCEPLN